METEQSSVRMNRKEFLKEEFFQLFSQHESRSDTSHTNNDSMSLDSYCFMREKSQSRLSDQTVPVYNTHASARCVRSFSSAMPHIDCSVSKVEKQTLETVKRSSISNPTMSMSCKRNPSQMFALFCGKTSISPATKTNAGHNFDNLFPKRDNCIIPDVSESKQKVKEFKTYSNSDDTFRDTYFIKSKGNANETYEKLSEHSAHNPNSGEDRTVSILRDGVEGSVTTEISPILTPDSFISDHSQADAPGIEEPQVVEVIDKDIADCPIQYHIRKSTVTKKDENSIQGIKKENCIRKVGKEIQDKTRKGSCYRIEDTENHLSFEADSESISEYLDGCLLTKEKIHIPDNEKGDCNMILSSLPLVTGTQTDEKVELKRYLANKQGNLDTQNQNGEPYPYSKPEPPSGLKHLSGAKKRCSTDTNGRGPTTHPGSLFQYSALAREKREETVGLSSLDTMTMESGARFGLDEIEESHGTRICAKQQPGLSPEFFPVQILGNCNPKKIEPLGKVTVHKKGVRIWW